MDITCLKSLNYNLFSGSLDMIARMWNVNKGAPEILYDTRNQQITAIESGIFDEKVVLFTGGKDNTVQCFGITDKKQLFEFVLNHNLVPKLIGFVAGNDEKKGNHAKLMIVSKNIKYKAYMKILHKYQIHFFEF